MVKNNLTDASREIMPDNDNSPDRQGKGQKDQDHRDGEKETEVRGEKERGGY